MQDVVNKFKFVTKTLGGNCKKTSYFHGFTVYYWIRRNEKEKKKTTTIVDEARTKLLLGGRVLKTTLLWKRNGGRISDFRKRHLTNSAMNCDPFCRRNLLACERRCMLIHG